jgi:Phosphotransferase enzyme family
VNAHFKTITGGHDSVAVDVDDRLIFKFPRHAAAQSALVREAALLAAIRPHIRLAVPQMRLHGDPVEFSSHQKIRGEQLLSEHYQKLPETARDLLARTLAQFYADLHALDPAELMNSGATPLVPWLPADEIRAKVFPLLPAEVRDVSNVILRRYAELATDPHGNIYGMFDCHGWNMAFVHAERRLNGVYDFSDSGLGPLHQDFIYPAFISPELPARIVTYYESACGRMLDIARIATLIGTHRLLELATAVGSPGAVASARDNVLSWLQYSSALGVKGE